MARTIAVAATSTAVLFIVFTFASASIPSDLPSLVESDPKPKTTIILPSEKPETEPATFVELEPEETEIADSKLPEIEKDSTEKRPETESEPLTVITFHPVNRQFARRPLFPFRRGKGCDGRRQHRFNQLKARDGQRSYGDDMILSGGEDFGFEKRMPGRWARINHGGNRFTFVSDEGAKKEEMNDRFRFHHHRRHHHHHHHDHEEEGDLKEEHRNHDYFKGGFMKGIRKFLNNF